MSRHQRTRWIPSLGLFSAVGNIDVEIQACCALGLSSCCQVDRMFGKRGISLAVHKDPRFGGFTALCVSLCPSALNFELGT
jgi:hypothetical protein